MTHHKTLLRNALDASAAHAIAKAIERDGYSGPNNTRGPTRALRRVYRAWAESGTIDRALVGGVLVWVLI